MPRLEIATKILCALMTEPKWTDESSGIYQHIVEDPNDEKPLANHLVEAALSLTDLLIFMHDNTPPTQYSMEPSDEQVAATDPDLDDDDVLTDTDIPSEESVQLSIPPEFFTPPDEQVSVP